LTACGSKRRAKEKRVNDEPRILVVDDNEDSCMMMAALLGQIGYTAEAARTVAGALKAARDRRPALYILDSYFSDGRGADLCRRLRADDAQAPVIFYSCDFDAADLEAALGAGAQAYVVKPDIDELLRAVSVCLDRMGDAASQPALLYS
jgi:DNA-binding response OmpR family regulator